MVVCGKVREASVLLRIKSDGYGVLDLSLSEESNN